MFSIPQPLASPTEPDRPIIAVSEDARTINFIMQCCYPILKPSLTELDEIGAAIAAAQKYELPLAMSMAKDALLKLVKTHTLDVFAVAVRFELYDVCRLAAIKSLSRPILAQPLDDLDNMLASDYQKLVSYHHSCTFILDAEIESWFSAKSGVDSDLADVTPPLDVPHRGAETPFNDRAADVVLRSLDRVHFHVYKNILSIASPVFSRMLDSASHTASSAVPSASNERGPVPILDLNERAPILELILRTIYPVRSPTLAKLSDVRHVLRAGREYQIDAAIGIAEAALPEFIAHDALGVFAVACSFKLEPICALATRHLAQPLRSTTPELSSISARRYRTLLQYHHQCGGGGGGAIRSREWLSQARERKSEDYN